MLKNLNVNNLVRERTFSTDEVACNIDMVLAQILEYAEVFLAFR